MSGPNFLPYGRHVIDEADVAAVSAVLRGDWLTTGPVVEAMEAALASRLAVEHVVACNSGTAALHLALAAAGVGPGDAAIVPSLTFAATANAARFVGAEVMFTDVDPETGLMAPEHLKDALSRAGSSKLRVVLPVHLGGHIADLPALRTVAENHGLAVVEDACHALGGAYGRGNRQAPIGACADSLAACFSFHPVKTVAMGEGGAVTTNDRSLAERMRRLRSHAIDREPEHFQCPELAMDGAAVNPWYYEVAEIGWNYRASDINCALGLSQLAKLDSFLAKRRRFADLYDALLMPLAPIVRSVPRPPEQIGGWHLYRVLIDFPAAGVSRGDLMRRLHAKGIGSQVHYIPVHRLPYYRNRYGEMNLPGADAYYARCLSLPLYPTLTEADIARVVETLAEALGLQSRAAN